MNSDTVSGKVDQLKGQVKQSFGETIHDESLANSGTADQVKGNAKEAWGTTKDAASTAAADAKVHGEAEHADAQAHHEETAHNVRESIVDASEKVKDFVKGH